MTYTKKIKRIVAAVICIAAVIGVVSVFGASASQYDCFTVLGDRLLPLEKATLPALFGTTLYVPGKHFEYFDITISYVSSTDNYSLQKGNRRLNFYLSRGSGFDQDGKKLDYGAETVSGVVFLPIDVVCDHFGLKNYRIPHYPASILRITDNNTMVSDEMFLNLYSGVMNEDWARYAGSAATPTPLPPPPEPSANATPNPLPSYERTTLYLSFWGIERNAAREALGTLSRSALKACFYFSADEIRDYPDLVREIAGKGHSVGIRLTSGEYEEYALTAALLFDAAKLKVLRARSVAFDTSRTNQTLPTGDYQRAELRIQCGDYSTSGLADAILRLKNAKYRVEPMRETTSEVNYGS